MIELGSHYNGNINLRGIQYKRNFSEEELKEFKLCKDDFFHYLNWNNIISLDDGIVPFIPREYQTNFFNLALENRFFISVTSRQIGKSTMVAALASHFIRFNKNVTVAFLAQDYSGAKELLEKSKLSIELLPDFLKPTILDWNKNSIKLGNGSRIITASSSGDGIRGRSINLLVLDEFAFIEDPEAFMASVYPVIAASEKSRIIIISTPNGLNEFYNIYRNAELNLNGYGLLKISYKDVPMYNSEKWKNETISRIGLKRFLREFDCNFEGSSSSLIDGILLGKLTPSDNLKHPLENYSVHQEFIEDENIEYLAVLDPSSGKGLDFSVLSIFKIDNRLNIIELVALFRDNSVSPIKLCKIISDICRLYENPPLLIENNKFDSIGFILEDRYEYPEILRTCIIKRKCVIGGGSNKSEIGVFTTNKIKSIGCEHLKVLIESGKCKINFQIAIDEFKIFSENSNGSYSAENNGNDDICMTFVLMAWAILNLYFDIDIIGTLADSENNKQIKKDKTTNFIGIFGDDEIYSEIG